MRRDGRSFDHRTLEAIRLMAVERVRDGDRPSSVIASFGFNRTTIYRWLDAASFAFLVDAVATTCVVPGSFASACTTRPSGADFLLRSIRS
jgi:hypothetical protein